MVDMKIKIMERGKFVVIEFVYGMEEELGDFLCGCFM